MTNGGHRITAPLPLSDARLFAPWRPIPVAPIWPTAWLSVSGLRVIVTELVMFGWLAAWAV